MISCLTECNQAKTLMNRNIELRQSLVDAETLLEEDFAFLQKIEQQLRVVICSDSASSTMNHLRTIVESVQERLQEMTQAGAGDDGLI
jgi:hypothetical protein